MNRNLFVHGCALLCLFAFSISAETAKTPAPTHMQFNSLSAQKLVPKVPAEITLRLETSEAAPITPNLLKQVQRRKMDLLLIDPALSEYHHLYPAPTPVPGEYLFKFRPRRASYFKGWVDITLATSGKREIVGSASLGERPKKTLPIPQRKEALSKTLPDGMEITLSFDTPLAVGKKATGTLQVKDKDGSDFKALQPVLGTFAHIIGFPEDLSTPVIGSLLGKEPVSGRELAGPALKFHFMPSSRGFIRIFTEFRIHGKLVFVPFGVFVK